MPQVRRLMESSCLQASDSRRPTVAGPSVVIEPLTFTMSWLSVKAEAAPICLPYQ